MPEGTRTRLRIRLPTGAELEAEGAADFVQGEREIFLASAQRPETRAGDAGAEAAAYPPPAWDSITETRGPNLQLRGKFRGEKTDKDACLVLMAAAQKLLNAPRPTAAQLARWLRASGYPVLRVDRALAEGLQKGEILASGSRRARRYELTGPGRAKAFLLANELTLLIKGAPGPRPD